MDKHTPYYELMEAIRDTGCPICRLAIRSGDRFLETYSYEHVNDIEIRELVRAARGFCHNHTWRLFHKHSPLGTALTYYDILGEAAQQIGAAKEQQSFLRSLAARVRKLLTPKARVWVATPKAMPSSATWDCCWKRCAATGRPRRPTGLPTVSACCICVPLCGRVPRATATEILLRVQEKTHRRRAGPDERDRAQSRLSGERARDAGGYRQLARRSRAQVVGKEALE